MQRLRGKVNLKFLPRTISVDFEEVFRYSILSVKAGNRKILNDVDSIWDGAGGGKLQTTDFGFSKYLKHFFGLPFLHPKRGGRRLIYLPPMI